jgi:hypothetical protein
MVLSSVSANEVQSDILDDFNFVHGKVHGKEFEFLLENRGSRIAEGVIESHGWRLVGTEKVTAYYCSTFRYLDGCLNVDEHNVVDVLGRDFSNKAIFKPTYVSCDKPSCPKCYRSWCLREARQIDAKLAVSGKKWGLAEHIVVSVALKDYNLSSDELYTKLYGYLRELGVVGAFVIPHPFRFDDDGRGYYSMHFYLLAHIIGGYKCRGCDKSESACRVCGLFVDKAYRLNERGGWIFRVLDKRKSVFWTAAYQLSHCGYRVGLKRHNVVRAVGVCKGLKVYVKKHRAKCPVCGNEFGRIVAMHGRKDALSHPVLNFTDCSMRCRVDDMYDPDGSVRYFEAVGGTYE